MVLPVDWNAYYANEQRRRVSLPTYPFERKRYWVEAQREVTAVSVPVAAEATVVHYIDY